jgi:hypothetical protein
MFTISDIFEKIYQNWWGILLYFFTFYLLYRLYKTTNDILEGFTTGNITIPEEYKSHACYGIRETLSANKKLIEGFREKHAVESLADTNSLIELLTTKWNQMNCEQVLAEHPMPHVHMPNMADLEEEIKKKVTAEIEAAIAAKEAEKKVEKT